MIDITLAWDAPTPAPTCGYKALYRRKGDSSYTEYDLSGITTTVSVDAPANYEGAVQSNCCGDVLATGISFGLNAYVPLNFTASISGTTSTFVLSSTYGNPYDALVSIEVNYHIGSTHTTFTSTRNYMAGSTTNTGTSVVSPGVVIDSYTINAISPVFDNGGTLQQFDPILTPDYFKFYRSTNISGTTWNGSPASLPSFTTDQFVVTETDITGTITLAGDLYFSYILQEQYLTSFTSVIFDVYDGATLIGSVILPTTPMGLRTGIIPLVKGSNSLDSSTQFTMKVSWTDDTLIDTHLFYFPI